MLKWIIPLSLAVAITGGASADVRNDWHAVAEAVRSTGLNEAAARIEAALAEVSDEELVRIYGDADLTLLTDALWQGAEALRRADAVTEGTVTMLTRRYDSQTVRSSTPGFPDAQGYPTAPTPCPFSPERSNADALLAAVDNIETLRVALNGAQQFWSGLDRNCEKVTAGTNNSLACVVADVALYAAELVLGLAESTVQHIKFCDDAVDAAEIEGSYERLGHFHADWTSKFPGPVTPFGGDTFRAGHGCNGIDDDGSGLIDECAEDVFAPFVHIDAAVSNPWYRALPEASAAVARAFHSFDECESTRENAPVLSGDCENVVASVTASDTCGNPATATTVVKVDGLRPDLSINPAVAASCYPSVAAGEQAVLNATSLADNCTVPAELDFRLDSTVTDCSMRVREEAIDLAGLRSVAAVTVRVDAERPRVEIDRLVLGFRGEVLGFQTPACYSTVAEAEQAVHTVTRVQDNCSSAENIATSVESSGGQCSLQVTARGRDECLNDNTDAVTVRVDADAPTVTVAVAKSEIGKHSDADSDSDSDSDDMVDVGFTFTATDNCGDVEVVHRVTSDERTTQGSKDGHPFPDAALIRDTAGQVQGVLLRAESNSKGNGRVYEISVTATDPCGNSERASVLVTVPHKRNKVPIDDGQRFDATVLN